MSGILVVKHGGGGVNCQPQPTNTFWFFRSFLVPFDSLPYVIEDVVLVLIKSPEKSIRSIVFSVVGSDQACL